MITIHRIVISVAALVYAIIGSSMLHNPSSWFLGPQTNDVQISIPVETNSTLSKDISRIWHEPGRRRVCVEMKKGARCPHPALLGRLSGPSLSLLEWTDENLHSSGNVLCGSYGDRWIDTGNYFIEIIALYCDDFGVSKLERREDVTGWFNLDLTTKCVENAENNRITGIQSMIHIPKSQRGSGDFQIGRWVKRAELPPRPLFTRYQPAGCVVPKPGGGGYIPIHPLPEWCSMVADRDIANYSTGTFVGLPEYEFQWGEKRNETQIVASLREVYRQTRGSYPPICVVGDSHSRFVTTRSVKALGVRGIMRYVKHQWPGVYSFNTSIEDKLQENKCEIVIIQIGQWPASWIAGGEPFSFGRYYSEMKALVETTSKVLRDVPNSKIYLPALDLGPLMGAVNVCKDWRTPTVMDAYSYVLQMIASETKNVNVEYIDTNFIIQTHWDGDPDW